MNSIVGLDHPDRFPTGCMVTTGIGSTGSRDIVYTNRYFYDSLGCDPASLVGKPLSALLSPASLIVFDTFMLPMLRHEGKCEEILLKARVGDGTQIPVMVNAQVRPNEDEHIYWTLFSAVQRNKLDKELVKVRKEAERANHAKSEFLSSMSHELRTPLNAILGFSQLMESDPSLPDELRPDVKDILSAGNHLLTLINDVLDLAQVESGKPGYTMEPVDVCELLDHCHTLTRTLAEEKGIAIRHKCSPGLFAYADQTRLRQVLLNLLSNAIKYNRDNGSVNIQAYPDSNGKVRIEVEDSGFGIALKDQEDLFKPFNRLGAESGDIEGTGIGLSITRAIMESMSGQIGVTSPTDRGSTFWITLPAAQPATDVKGAGASKPLPDKTPQAEQNRESAPHKQKTVLYVEDDQMNRKLVSHFLKLRANTELLTAESAAKGIVMALNEHPDLILLDINMPEMNGYQVLKILRAEQSLRSVPVIAVSAYAMPGDIERGVAAGFDNYLTKPLDVRQFLDVIDQNLEVR